MNQLRRIPSIAASLRSVFALTAVMSMIGCATFEATNWSERVGSYTIADAKQELGSPDRTKDTDDGGVIATWIQRSSYRNNHVIETGSSYDPRTDDQTGITHIPQSSVASESFMNLTFNEEGILSAWDTSAR